MHLACSYGEFAELGRHSVQSERAVTVLVDEQSVSKEVIPFDSKSAILLDDNLVTLLNQ